jgi:hypothetical protein
VVGAAVVVGAGVDEEVDDVVAGRDVDVGRELVVDEAVLVESVTSVDPSTVLSPATDSAWPVSCEAQAPISTARLRATTPIRPPRPISAPSRCL